MYITTLSARYKYTDVSDDSLPCGLKLIKDSVTVTLSLQYGYC